MFADTVLLAQIVSLIAVAGWITTGVWDNIFHPRNNELYTSQVMGMARMRDEYPDEFARVAHRAINNRTLQKVAFRVVVLAELAAALILWAGVVMMIVAWAGGGDMDVAKSVAMLGVLIFTSVWAGFLVVGNYFCYWFCHFEGQMTHYLMTLWGMGMMIFLAIG